MSMACLRQSPINAVRHSMAGTHVPITTTAIRIFGGCAGVGVHRVMRVILEPSRLTLYISPC
jgi:hypothetical protein